MDFRIGIDVMTTEPRLSAPYGRRTRQLRNISLLTAGAEIIRLSNPATELIMTP
jgi:hypothetical protein